MFTARFAQLSLYVLVAIALVGTPFDSFSGASSTQPALHGLCHVVGTTNC